LLPNILFAESNIIWDPAKSHLPDGADLGELPRDDMLGSQQAALRRNGKKIRRARSWSFLTLQHPAHSLEERRFMATLSQLHVIRLLVPGILLILPATSGAPQRPPILEKLTKTYGLESFGQIEAIRYTFNAEAAGLNISRSWTWEPKTEQVTYQGKVKSGNPVKVTYLRSQLGSEPANVKDDIDPGFLNDNYWLLLPFHFSWDTNPAVENTGVQKLPLGNGSAEKVVVKYPSDSGYSPGDSWEVYVGSDGRIEEMGYHRAGPPSSRSLPPGPTTRRPDRSSSRWITAERVTVIRCTFSSRMWPSNWRGQTPGWTRNKRRVQAGRRSASRPQGLVPNTSSRETDALRGTAAKAIMKLPPAADSSSRITGSPRQRRWYAHVLC
jgi:hypothetical protein